MIQLPFELWLHFAKTACFNDPYTRRSLLLSCKYLNEVAQCVIPDTIAIQGSRRFLSFARFLTLYNPQPWPIRNLYLETTPHYGIQDVKKSHRASIPLLEGRLSKMRNAAEQAMSDILRIFSSTLENLAVSDPTMVAPSFFPPLTSFPKLVHLAVIAKTFTMVELPALQRLHVAGFNNKRLLGHRLQLKEMAPVLKEVVFSDVTVDGSDHYHCFTVMRNTELDQIIPRPAPKGQPSDPCSPLQIDKSTDFSCYYNSGNGLNDWMDVSMGGDGPWSRTC